MTENLIIDVKDSILDFLNYEVVFKNGITKEIGHKEFAGTDRPKAGLYAIECKKICKYTNVGGSCYKHPNSSWVKCTGELYWYFRENNIR